MHTPVLKLLLEALVVAVMFVVLGAIVHVIAMRAFEGKAMTDHKLLAAQAAITAAIFHVLCEYTRINEWYCQNRPKVTKK